MFIIMFWFLAWVGRPFGGIRPRRIMHWLANKAYGKFKPQSSDYRWYRDRYGMEFLLHPHFLMDYEIIVFGTYDIKINSYIEKYIKQGMVCLDVGANIGVMSVHLAKKVGPTGLVHCIEPVPHLFHRLQVHVERNKLQTTARLHQIALSDKTGTLPIMIADEYLPNQGMSSITNKHHSQLINDLTIESMTLDAFSDKEILDRLDFVKLDIQGAEPFFLQGGMITLNKFKPTLMIEISPDDLSECGITPKDLLIQIESIGYKIFEITKSGQIGGRLYSSETPSAFFSSGVICIM